MHMPKVSIRCPRVHSTSTKPPPAGAVSRGRSRLVWIAVQWRSRASASAPAASACATARHLTICGALDEQELAQMSAIVSYLELAPGDPLFDEGQPAEHVFNVTAGAVKVYKLLADGRRQMTGFLFPGDFLGLANEETYAYSAEAVTHTVLCRFPRRKLERLLEQYPKMVHRLLGMASHELAVAQEQMLLLGRKTAREKIASFLLMMSRRSANVPPISEGREGAKLLKNRRLRYREEGRNAANMSRS